MNYLIISGNPKKDRLCHFITESVQKGAKAGGAQVDLLTVENLERCHVCGEGWGTCRNEHICAFRNDGFSEAQKAIQKADMFCFITPVYWWEMAESLKCFLTASAAVKLLC
jgi:multimeric flavodoxin WrbA